MHAVLVVVRLRCIGAKQGWLQFGLPLLLELPEVRRAKHRLASGLLHSLPRIFGHIAGLLAITAQCGIALCVSVAVQCRCCCLGQSSDRQLQDRLRVAQIVTRLQPLEQLMLTCGDAKTALAQNISQCGNLSTLTSATIGPLGCHTIAVDDPLGEYLDVVSCNEYVGWYDGLPQKIDGIQWTMNYQKPFVISEFGADAQAGRHGDDMTRFTEEYQANVYRRQVNMFRRIPFLTGTIAWVLVDFRSPRRPLAGIQDFYNRKGLFSDRGEPKKALYILRDYYRSLRPSGGRE